MPESSSWAAIARSRTVASSGIRDRGHRNEKLAIHVQNDRTDQRDGTHEVGCAERDAKHRTWLGHIAGVRLGTAAHPLSNGMASERAAGYFTRYEERTNRVIAERLTRQTDFYAKTLAYGRPRMNGVRPSA